MKMELRWTEEAAADLERITDYLFQNVPERAAELVQGNWFEARGFEVTIRPGARALDEAKKW